MKKILSLALVCSLTVGASAGLGAQVQNPGVVTGNVVQANGVISGSVRSSSGRPLSDITMQLVDAGGVRVRTTTTSKDGDFTLLPVAYDTYTLQCVQQNKVIGTSSVILKAATESVKMTCTSDAGVWNKAGVVTALAAVAAGLGATGIVSNKGDASGSR
jgi:hypothetical protein